MKNIWFGFWTGFDRIFSNPKEIHRVLIIIPLSILVSHALYIWQVLPIDYVFTTSDEVAIWLGCILSSFVLCWCFRSNEMSIDLFNRFMIVSALSGLFHRITFYAIELGDAYFVTLSILAFSLLGIWAVTGKNYREIKRLYIRPALHTISTVFIRHEKKDNIVAISDRAINE